MAANKLREKPSSKLLATIITTRCWHFWRRQRMYYCTVMDGGTFKDFCDACDTKYIEPSIPEDYKWYYVSRSTSRFD